MEADDVRSKLWNNAIERASKDLEAVAADQSAIERTVASVDALVAQVSHSVECLFPTNGKESHVVVEKEDIQNYLALERELNSTALPHAPANVKPRDNVAVEKKLLKEFGDLAKQMAKSCSLDVMEAQYSRRVGEATALYNRRVELLRQLADQHTRLQRVKRAQERRGASTEAVSDHIAEARTVLESRLDECSVIMAATQDLQVMPLDTPPFMFKKFVAEPGCAEDFDKLCKELRGNLTVENRRLEALQNDQRHVDELVADFHRELLKQCQGSIPAWCADQKAAMKGNRNEVIVRELFKEFHRNPDKFVKRMRASKTRGVPGSRGASVGS
ncbi:hypothetical protein HPB47_009705 [Ixodes persulcatus]|uniref:Uncharacterized protein n=1 Tax=Ixodes persulcatus TaxID=34615 RepID=A0AC60P1D1_IXOPE|nr:hypothetical protein HPB47_009705 [Ixodes persulcatus]